MCEIHRTDPFPVRVGMKQAEKRYVRLFEPNLKRYVPLPPSLLYVPLVLLSKKEIPMKKTLGSIKSALSRCYFSNCGLSCLVFAAALCWSSLCLGDGDLLERVNNVTVFGPAAVLVTGGTGPLPPTGNFSIIGASAFTTTGGLSRNYLNQPLPYVVGAAPYNTGLQTSVGTVFTANSQVAASTTALTPALPGPPAVPAMVTWAETPAPFNITPVPGSGLSGTRETAIAIWQVHDPVTMSVQPGDSLSVALQLTNDLGLIVPQSGPRITYSAQFAADSGTNLPGYANLFDLSISLSSATPGIPAVTFSSNPLLGLNDAAISSDLTSRFSYNVSTGNYAFDSSGLSLDATLLVPTGASSVTVTTSLGDELDASASATPEPSSFVNASIAIVMSLSFWYWKRHRTASIGPV